VEGAEEYYNDPTYCVRLTESFAGGSLSTSATMGDLGWTSAGGGAAPTRVISEDRFGVVNINGTTAPSDRLIGLGAAPNWAKIASGDNIIWNTVLRVSGLSTAAQEYYWFCGISDYPGSSNNTLDQLAIYALGFEYYRLKTTNWLLSTNDSVNYYSVNSNNTVGTGYTDLKLIWNVSSGYARGYINDTLIGTQSSGLPYGRVSPAAFYLYKGTGSSQVTVIVDHFSMIVAGTARRIP
jgi:hypothetical protein